VVDLGCWPGGWIQVAESIVGPRGRIVGVDLVELDPFPGLANVQLLQGDFGEAACRAALQRALEGRADVILSDAAP
jgi:23S rRNA (uridine2552-2'-O)-methyltransferase